MTRRSRRNHSPACLAKVALAAVRGPPRYENYLAAIKDPHHPDHEHLLEWGTEAFDPKVFDQKAIEHALDRLAQKWDRNRGANEPRFAVKPRPEGSRGYAYAQLEPYRPCCADRDYHQRVVRRRQAKFRNDGADGGTMQPPPARPHPA